jgi:transposase
MQAEVFPERAQWFRTTSALDPYRSYLELRWEQGCRNARALWHELVERGFAGGYMIVYRWLQLQPETTESQQAHTLQESPSAETEQRSLEAPRHLAWLLVGDPTHLDEQDQHTLSFLRQDTAVNRAYELAQQLIAMVKERSADSLEAWLLLCTQSGIVEVENFAHGLQKEFTALQAALTLPYSNGPIEGQITKLKLIKRSMYGRGGFELLRRKVLTSLVKSSGVYFEYPPL